MSLLILLQVWLVIVLAGYACMFWALEPGPISEAITISGSSLLTLGFRKGDLGRNRGPAFRRPHAQLLGQPGRRSEAVFR